MPRLTTVAVTCLLVLPGYPHATGASAGQAPTPPPAFARPTLAPTVQALESPDKEAIIAAIEGFLRSEDFFDAAELDAVVMVWVFHHLERPVALLERLAPSLKPGAWVAILDPAFDPTGERDSDRPSTAESVRKEAAEAGYELVRTETFLPYDTIFVLRLGRPAR